MIGRPRLANDEHIFGVVHRLHFHHGIVVDKIQQAAAAYYKAGHDFALVNRIACASDHTPLNEVEYNVRKHFGMDAQIATIGQLVQGRITDSADAELER